MHTTFCFAFFIKKALALIFFQHAFQIFVGHGADAGVGPHVFGGFNHVDDSINRKNNAHDADGRANGTHEGKGQEVTAHGDAGVADSGQHRYE